MTRNAIDGRSPESVVNVTRIARDTFVSTADLEFRSVVIEARLPRSGCCRMALFAIHSESRNPVVNHRGRIIVAQVTAHAITWRFRKSQVYMTVFAGNTPVLSDEAEGCSLVIELHRMGHLSPACCRMAVRTRHRNFTVG